MFYTYYSFKKINFDKGENLYVCGQICIKMCWKFCENVQVVWVLALPPSPPLPPVTIYVRYFILCIFSESRYLKAAPATPRLSPSTHLSPSTTHSPQLPQLQALQHLSLSTSTTPPQLPQLHTALLHLLSMPPPLLQHHHQRQQGGGCLLILLICMQ